MCEVKLIKTIIFVIEGGLKMNNSKYFIVNDKIVSDIMSAILNERPYKFYNKELGHDVYSFVRRDNIGYVYGRALTIIESL